MWLGIHIRNDGDAGLGNFDLGQHFFEGTNGGCHEFRVKGPSDGQLDRHACLELGFGELIDHCASGRRPRTGVVSIAQEVGNLDFFSRLFGGHFAQGTHLFLIQTNDTDHTGIDGIRSSLHGFSTSLGNLDTIGKAQGPGKAQGRVFSQGQAHGNGGVVNSLGFFLTQLFHSSHGSHKDSGLTDDSRVELFLGSFCANLQEIITQNFRRFVKQGLGCRNIIDNIAAHANKLSSLSREHEGHLGREVVKVIIRPSQCRCRHGTTKGRRHERRSDANETQSNSKTIHGG
mmetsp:Transcript_16870/g.34001  ORF Transcript_16870/g.34001 Transcript_16870/m.34001 type:complete len:287 (-) Transcript_16870:90-950(-)